MFIIDEDIDICLKISTRNQLESLILDRVLFIVNLLLENKG